IGGDQDYDFHTSMPTAYTNNLRKGLDILYNNVPRAFVNLVVVMQVGLTQILHNGLISTIMLRLGCPCGAFPRSEGDIEQLAEYTEAYQQAVLDLADSGDYDSDTFTVVAQTFFQNMTIPYNDENGEIDYSFFAIDRFHISKRGHALAGRGLWNNMFEPVGNKTAQVNWYDTEVVCPTEEFPYLFTNQNSDIADFMPPATGSFLIDSYRLVKLATGSFLIDSHSLPQALFSLTPIACHGLFSY
ncbi:hypothetical protein RRG08_011471, partial [Elysia crispata]